MYLPFHEEGFPALVFPLYCPNAPLGVPYMDFPLMSPITGCQGSIQPKLAAYHICALWVLTRGPYSRMGLLCSGTTIDICFAFVQWALGMLQIPTLYIGNQDTLPVASLLHLHRNSSSHLVTRHVAHQLHILTWLLYCLITVLLDL